MVEATVYPLELDDRSNMGYSVGKEDLKVIPLLKSLAAELLGTMLLVIFGCGTAMQDNGDGYSTKVSLAFGLAVMAIACFTGHVSGGNLNPAVSVGLLAGGQLSVIKCCLYIVAQCLGAIAGAGILYGATGEGLRGGLGSNMIGTGSAAATPFGGMVMELIGSMLLVLVVFATAVDKRNNSSPMLPPLLIGLTVTVAHLLLIPYTGTSINPARSLGPAIVANIWKDHWVFWIGPLLGGAIGGVLYRFVFMNNDD